MRGMLYDDFMSSPRRAPLGYFEVVTKIYAWLLSSLQPPQQSVKPLTAGVVDGHSMILSSREACCASTDHMCCFCNLC